MLIFLLLFWVILSAQLSVFFIIAAIFSTISIIIIDKKLFNNSCIFIKPNFRWIIFAASLFKEMFISSVDVIKIIWNKPKNIKPVYDWIDNQSTDPTLKTTYANSITLTPGTMSMELKENKILIHAISQEAMLDLQKGKLENKLSQVNKP